MINAKQPLIYFANNSDFEAQYDNTAANEYREKQAVFVGDTHMIYTHGQWFNCNNTQYDDTELRGLISNAEYDDTELRGLISDHSTFLSNLDSRMDNIYDEISSDVDDDIKALLKNAQWLKQNFANGNIGEVFSFGDLEGDVKEYLIGLGLIQEYEDGNETKIRVGWSSLQAQYNSLQAAVAQLAAGDGDVDVEVLESQLKLYIDGEVDAAEARLDTKYALTDAEGRALEWLSSGFQSSSNQYQTFANMYSAAMTDYGTAISGVSTRVQTLENAGYQTEAQVGTKITNAISGIDTAISGMDTRITANENSISAMSQFGTRIGDLESGLSTVSTKANGNETAIANLFASNGTGTQAISAGVSAYVTNWWSGVTISADDIYLDGMTWAQYINALSVTANSLHTANTTQNYSYVTDISGDTIRLRWQMTKNGIDYDNSVFITGGNPSSDQAYGMIGLGRDLNNLSIKIDSLGIECPTVTCTDVNATNITTDSITASTMTSDSITCSDTSNGDDVTTTVDANGITVQTVGNNLYTNTISSDSIVLDGDGGTVSMRNGAIGTTGNISTQSAFIVGQNTINSNGVSLSNKDITGARNIAAKNISLTAEYDGVGVEETSIVPGTIIIYDTESDGSIAFDSGNAYFGTAPNQNTLNAISNNAGVEINGANSAVTANNFEQSSDRNLKDIVSDTTLTVEQVAEAPAVNFTWKKDSGKEDKKQNVGTIAQYWQVVLPEVTGEAKDGSLTLQYGNAAMVSSIVTAKEVVALKEEIAELKRQIAELKGN